MTDDDAHTRIQLPAACDVIPAGVVYCQDAPPLPRVETASFPTTGLYKLRIDAWDAGLQSPSKLLHRVQVTRRPRRGPDAVELIAPNAVTFLHRIQKRKMSSFLTFA